MQPTTNEIPRARRWFGADPRERPAEQTRQRRHSERRSQAEQADVGQLRRRRRQRGEHERGQRAASREAVDGADDERTSRERPGADVHVRRARAMDVDEAAVPMRVHRPRVALADRLPNRTQAQSDQHQRDEELEQIRDARRHLRAQRDEHRAHDDERARVAQPPARAEKRRLVTAALAA